MNAHDSSGLRVYAALALSMALGGAVAFGCSSDNSSPGTQPPPIGDDDSGPPKGTGGSSGASGSGGESSVDSGAGGTATGGAGATSDGGDVLDGGDASASGGHPATGTGGASDGGPVCDPKKTGTHPKACFPCDPTKNDEFLNHCTTSDCQPFDNATRLGAANWNDGKLIPLQ
jgi:hypothetical protein